MEAQSKVLGPYEVISEMGPVGRVLETIPFSKVRGSQILINVSDNFATLIPSGSSETVYMAVAEVEILGTIQGTPFVLKRQACKAVTGPMFYVFEDAEAYDSVILRARNLTGGRRGPAAYGGGVVPSAENGFSIKVIGALQPRGGVGPKPQWKGMG